MFFSLFRVLTIVWSYMFIFFQQTSLIYFNLIHFWRLTNVRCLCFSLHLSYLLNVFLASDAHSIYPSYCWYNNFSHIPDRVTFSPQIPKIKFNNFSKTQNVINDLSPPSSLISLTSPTPLTYKAIYISSCVMFIWVFFLWNIYALSSSWNGHSTFIELRTNWPLDNSHVSYSYMFILGFTCLCCLCCYSASSMKTKYMAPSGHPVNNLNLSKG